MEPELSIEIIGIQPHRSVHKTMCVFSGNVGVILFNFGKTAFMVRRGDRIAQLICEKAEHPTLLVVSSLDETGRNEKGFGSSDVEVKST